VITASAARRGAAIAFAALALGAANLAGADREAGRRKAEVCAACHGPAGNSVDPAVPSIAGQPAQFVSTELFLFREGNRKDPQMSPIAAGLSNGDLNDLAEYFAAEKPAPPKHRSASQNAAAGPALAHQFNCVQCHGRELLGQQHIPRLAGQQPDYLLAQLRGFKAGTRADIDGNMTSAAHALSDQDIEVLADYLAGLDAGK
jgi:cytochrome c553